MAALKTAVVDGSVPRAKATAVTSSLGLQGWVKTKVMCGQRLPCMTG